MVVYWMDTWRGAVTFFTVGSGPVISGKDKQGAGVIGLGPGSLIPPHIWHAALFSSFVFHSASKMRSTHCQ